MRPECRPGVSRAPHMWIGAAIKSLAFDRKAGASFNAFHILQIFLQESLVSPDNAMDGLFGHTELFADRGQRCVTV